MQRNVIIWEFFAVTFAYGANDGKKHPILAKFGCVLYKIGILMGGKWGQS